MVPMRRIAVLTLLALSGCGPATAPAASGAAGTSAPGAEPQGNTAVIPSGDGFHVSTAAASRVVTHEIAAPVDRVWQVLPDVYRELGITARADAGLRTVATPSALRFTRRMFGEPATRFFDCGRGQFGAEIASTHTINLVLSSTVQPGPTPGSARLETTAQAHARNNDGANALMSQCHSRGVLEGLIALRVREKLAG